MIRIVEDLGNGKVLVESDQPGKLLDIGGGPARRMIARREEIAYMDEVDPPVEPAEEPAEEPREETPEEVG